MKGKYKVDMRTSAGQWMADKEWQRKANPEARAAELRYMEMDRKYLEKNRKQRQLKNMAMEQQYKMKSVVDMA